MTVNVTYREPGAVVPGSTTIKNSPLSNAEIDGNFKSVKDAVEVLSTTGGAALIGVAPVGGVAATTVQAAISELDSEKAGLTALAAPSGSSLVGYDTGTVQDVLDAVTGPTGAASVGYAPAGTGAVATTVQSKLLEIKSSADYSTWAPRNLAIGKDNFLNGAPTVENLAVGYDVLKSLTTGYGNIGLGSDVLSANTSGYFNMAIGIKALYKNTTGIGNIAFGAYSAYENKAGSSNTAYGEDSNRYLDGGNRNVAIGTQSLYNNVTGTENTAVGTYAARNAENPPDDGAGTGPSPTFITAIGSMALYNASGTLNTGVGHSAGYNTSGSYNTYAGANAGSQITSGAHNLFLGFNAGANASQGASASNCVAIGQESYTTGDNAIAIGSAVFAPADKIVIGNVGHTDVFFYGNIKTQLDNTYDIGDGAGRFKTIYATTGTINTSDEREKQDIAELDATELRVATALKGLVKKFRYKDSVFTKGTAARIHVGVIAQEVMAAFASENLDPMRYGIICYDEWDERQEVAVSWDAEYDEQGNLTREAGSSIAQHYRAAGNRYGVRYEELLAFIIAAL